MKDISPSEREILERASTLIPVFERQKNKGAKKTFNFQHGCYDCDHNVGPLGSQNRYRTLIFTDDLDNEKLLGITYCPQDRFWQVNGKKLSWIKYADTLITHTSDHKAYWYHAEESPCPLYDPEATQVYVRLIWTPDRGLRHINSKINIADYITENVYEDAGFRIHAYGPTAKTVVRPDLMIKNNESWTVDPELDLWIMPNHPHVVNNIMIEYGLERTSDSDQVLTPFGRTKKQAKQKRPTITESINLADYNIGGINEPPNFTVDPFEQGDE